MYEIGDGYLTSPNQPEYRGFYWARSANVPDGPDYAEWKLAGTVGPSGAWHEYKVRWNKDLGGWDVYIDGVYKDRAKYNQFRGEEIETGLEAAHCMGSSTQYSIAYGTLMQDWYWWENDGDGHSIVPANRYKTQPAGRVEHYDSSTKRRWCASLATTDWCDD